MPEPLVPLAAVEAALADLGAHLEWPSLPDAVSATRNRITAGERAPAPRPRWRPLAVVAAGLALALAVALVVPGTRHALADLFGIGGVTVRQVPTTLPSPPPGSAPTAGLDLGAATTLGAAGTAMGVPLFVPSGLGPPDGVFVDDGHGRPVVSLTYGPRAGLPAAPETDLGLLVTEFAGSIDRFIQKQVGPGQAERVTVDGRPALWVQGRHELLYDDGRGGISTSDSRLAASTLVVSRDGTTIRLEGGFDRATAIALAESLAPATGG